MNNLREIWSSRFFHYVNELQKYMRYVFTGHLAIVLMFAIGAGGYAYSEWLKEVPATFPSSLIVAVVLGLALTAASPTTLLKPADLVYFLPLEHKLPDYLKRAISWSTVSRLPLPLILLIVALPLLKATEVGTNASYLLLAGLIVLLNWLFVRTEYEMRHATGGEVIWQDRLIRFVGAFAAIEFGLTISPFVMLLVAAALAFYYLYWKRQAGGKPFPYEHFIELEQNRMMRLYRFANYFTDVPHLRGSVSKRSWLGFFMQPPAFGSRHVQPFLVRRTFLRTDETFWLWVRLTALSALGALFIPFPIVSFIFLGALAFATSIQLIMALEGGDEFRMDLLFPAEDDARTRAIRALVRKLQWLQAAIALLAALGLYGFSAVPVLIAFVVVIISEATIRLTKEQKTEW